MTYISNMSDIKREPMDFDLDGEQIITAYQNVKVKSEPLEYLEENAEEKRADVWIKKEINTSLETILSSSIESKDRSEFDSSSERFMAGETSAEDLKQEHTNYETWKSEYDYGNNEDICNSATDAIKKETGDSNPIFDRNTEGLLQVSRITEASETTQDGLKVCDTKKETKSVVEVYIDRDDSMSQNNEAKTADVCSCIDCYSPFPCPLNLQSQQDMLQNEDCCCVSQPSQIKGNCQSLDANTMCHTSHTHNGNINECNSDQMKIVEYHLPHVSSQDDVSKNCVRDKRNHKFGCEVCGKKFTTSVFQRHMRSHTGEKPFECHVCGNKFTRKCNLEQHKRTHTGYRPFTCVECGAAFTRKEHLKGHTRIHTGSKPYSCMECGAAFIGSGDLHRHKRVHTGEKPFKCDLCSKAFSQTTSLRKHKRTHSRERKKKFSGGTTI